MLLGHFTDEEMQLECRTPGRRGERSDWRNGERPDQEGPQLSQNGIWILSCRHWGAYNWVRQIEDFFKTGEKKI